jgi:hypothetical protein
MKNGGRLTLLEKFDFKAEADHMSHYDEGY